MKKVIVLFLFVICLTSVSAALNMRINGQINYYSSDVWLKTNPLAGVGYDSYDMIVPSAPSNYSKFFSDIPSHELAVDSWNTTTRTLNLVYYMDIAQDGTLTISWDSLSGSDYKGTLTDYGNDANRLSGSIVGTANLRSSSSYSSTLSGETNNYYKIYIDDYTAPTTTTTTTTTTGGGGGGGTPTYSQAVLGKLVLDPIVLDIPIVINTVKTKKIEASNTGDATLILSVYVHGLDDIIKIKDEDLSFVLEPRRSHSIDVRVIAPEEPGIYTGKILVGGKEILVIVSASTEEFLFDASVEIPSNFKTIKVGKKLESQITLIPMGEEPRMDVTLNYVIKDFDGRTFVTESETFLVEGQKTFKKEFATQGLPEGDYVLGIELIYPNGVATSTSHFAVKKSVGWSPNLLLVGLGIGIFTLIILIVLVMKSYKKIGKFKHKR